MVLEGKRPPCSGVDKLSPKTRRDANTPNGGDGPAEDDEAGSASVPREHFEQIARSLERGELSLLIQIQRVVARPAAKYQLVSSLLDVVQAPHRSPDHRCARAFGQLDVYLFGIAIRVIGRDRHVRGVAVD